MSNACLTLGKSTAFGSVVGSVIGGVLGGIIGAALGATFDSKDPVAIYATGGTLLAAGMIAGGAIGATVAATGPCRAQNQANNAPL